MAQQKPDAPGIWMNFDNTVSLYHTVAPTDTFEQAAQAMFSLVREAQDRYPDWPRLFYLDIEGHLDRLGRFEPDFVELQQEFLFSVVGPFVTAVDTPLVSALNPDRQRNDLPHALGFGDAPTEAPPACG
ncbi:MAG: hypothetical protein IAE99_04005 [Rhodothermales bacterium]|nr:hypothetical protein [Rhodothermales bacterium]